MTEKKVEIKKPQTSRLTCSIPHDVAEQYRRAAAAHKTTPKNFIAKILCDAMQKLIAERKGKPFPEPPKIPGLTLIAPEELEAKLAKQPNDLLQMKVMAETLGVSTNILNSWRKAGCPHIKMAAGKGAVFFLKSDVLEWLRKNSIT